MEVIKKEEYIEDLLIQIPLQQAIENNTIDAIALDKVKQAREKIHKLDDLNPDYPMDRTIHVSRNEVLEILDELIESEDKNIS